MGCKKPNRTSLWTFVPDPIQPTSLQLSDNIECYTARAGVPDGYAGAKDDKPDTITTTSIVPDCDMNVDVTFRVSGPRTPSYPNGWYRHTTPNGDGVSDPAAGIGTVFFTENGDGTARFHGTFDAVHSGKRFEFYITAKDGAGRIDTRHYIVTPQKCEKSSDIKFIHPLPGSTRTSKFGPRKRPCESCSDAHKGVDFAFGGGRVDDVIASADGEVVFAGTQNGYGNIVILLHKNGAGKVMAETRYAHLETIYVSKGQKIPAGTKVGREGNTGVGTGKHLHFEIRVNGTPVDPEQYISGQLKLASSGTSSDVYNSNDPAPQQVNKSDPGTPTGTETTKNNQNVALTQTKVDNTGNKCPPEVIDPAPVTAPPPSETAPKLAVPTQPNSPCIQKPDPVYPSASAVVSAIDAVLNTYGWMDAGDKSYIKFTSQIESTNNRFAKNPTSTATGLYQFLDFLAFAYYGDGANNPLKTKYPNKTPGYAAPPVLSSIPPTCENRCNIEYATHAMVEFYKKEVLKYWNEWISSGKTKIAGRKVDLGNPHIQNLQTANKMEFCYAVHHEGPGVLAAGKTSEGINYFRSRAKALNFTA